MNNLYKSLLLVIPAVILMGCIKAPTSNDVDTSTTEEVAVETTPSADNLKEPTSKLMIVATIAVPETSNVLVDISNETGTTVEYEDGEESGTVTLIDKYTKSVDKSDYVAILAINRGGSGEEFYLATFQPGENSNRMSDSVYLGDRLDMVDVSVTGDDVIVYYMEHGENQAMAEEPNVKVAKSYTYSDGKLLETTK